MGGIPRGGWKAERVWGEKNPRPEAGMNGEAPVREEGTRGRESWFSLRASNRPYTGKGEGKKVSNRKVGRRAGVNSPGHWDQLQGHYQIRCFDFQGDGDGGK